MPGTETASREGTGVSVAADIANIRSFLTGSGQMGHSVTTSIGNLKDRLADLQATSDRFGDISLSEHVEAMCS